jgi:vitamin B12 transporter
MKMNSGLRFVTRVVLALLIFGLTAAQLVASSTATISGTISDTLGAVIQNATVELLEIDTGKVVQTTNSGVGGHYSFAVAGQGRYRIRAQAASFQPASSDQKFVAGAHPLEIDLTLSPSVVAQQIVVIATGVPTPEVQTGASISVIGEESLGTRRAVEEELRIEPGTQVTSTGQIGAVTALYVRGGPSNANMLIIDGVPADDIGGAVNFANLSAAGYEKAELYRGPNSALFGSGAYADVLDIVTRRGVTPLPELGYAVDGGTFGTLHQEANLGGAWRRFDYFTDFSRFGTQNSTPNSEFHNASYLGNLGWQLLPNTELRATVRRSVSAFNAANAIALYGIPDDGVSREQDTAFGATLENRPTPRWHNLLRYAGLRLRSEYTNGGATGIPAFDPFGNPIYLGDVVTIRGANGYQATGQGILQFAPGAYSTSALSDRDSVYAQSDYRVNSALAALFAFRYDAEGGYTNDGFAKSTVERSNYNYMMQLNGGLWNRLFYTAGAGLENNALFGFAGSPRASLAYYIAKPRDQGILSGTRLVFNFGKGVNEPSIYYETNSLYNLLQSLPNGEGLPIIAQYAVRPFRWELSRTYDGGVQQTLLHGKARLSITYFHNEFGDQAEFVPLQGLAELGVPEQEITAIGALIPGGFFGAVLNTLSYSAQGAEVEAEYHITRNLSVRGGWTYTDAVVQHSFSSDALFPSSNPAFPNISIGAYSPLKGARPFHIAPHTGYFAVDWSAGRCLLRMTGTLVSRRDDSTFLSDQSYGSTMLLPNRNLDPAYQRLDLFGSIRLARRVRAYASMENLLNQRYYESFGYPALPFTIRSGVEFKFGGESWKF